METVEQKPKKSPRTIRLSAEQEAILKKIVETYSPPGYRLSYSAAMKIALEFWSENYSQKSTKKQE